MHPYQASITTAGGNATQNIAFIPERFSIEVGRQIGYKCRLMEKRWQLANADGIAVAALKQALGCHPVIAALLVNRRLTSPEQADRFLHASIAHLRPPTGLKDLEKAVERLVRAIAAEETILLFGDYDVDGTTATAVLFEFLKACNADVSYYIPHRLNEGYGLQARHITEVAVPRGATLLITVDCGSNSHAAADAARTAGIDVIITDHHHVSFPLPQAVAVINPKRRDCPGGLNRLAGVGVAFYLAVALRRRLRETGFWAERTEPNLRFLCDLVALGTIADMVPLLEENRILAKTGLEVIGSGRRPGVAALLDAAGISHRPMDSDDIAFRLAPRLNAAGRIDHAGLAVDLLIADQMDTARRLAHTLNQLNASRQELERCIWEDLQTQIARQPDLLKGQTLVLADPGWHAGVIGIAASRMMVRYHRPVVLIALQGRSGRGSARGIPGIDLFSCLSACRMHLEELGGHVQAAGLRIDASRLPEFQQAFEAAVRSVANSDTFIPQIPIEAEVGLDAISEDLADQIEQLMPFGAENPEPLFMARRVTVVSSSRVGEHHRRMVLRSAAGPARRSFPAIQFHADPQYDALAHFERIAYKLRWNRWNGSKTLQLVVEEAAAR
ncbi:MAG: single-stranded-DNA-specific exonuclease RecJ [Desulfobacterales bacterium]|jgi:single-stranded-DNA-specific exonuclease|nr:single-stranded-DNA-specific exonuclease RecJ [Desulfobacterales bacterium]